MTKRQRPMEHWECICGVYTHDGWYRCRKCNRPHFYKLSQQEALVVVHKLNRLEQENADLRRWLARVELRAAELQGRLDGIAYHWKAIKKGAIENQANCAMIIGRIDQIAFLAVMPHALSAEEDTDAHS